MGDTEDRFQAEIDYTVRLNLSLDHNQTHASQKNHLQWLHDGDHNSKFFHTMNITRKTLMGLSSLMIDDELSVDPVAIADHVVHYYHEPFTAVDAPSFDSSILSNFIHPVVSQEDNDLLIVTPSADEIKWTVFGMKPSSSRGPDGFGDNLYQSCWDTISGDVIEAVRYLFETLAIPTRLILALSLQFLRRLVLLEWKTSGLLSWEITFS
ncbi:hypothetical protein ACS0TY_033201 [Phlomoides rotata]